MLAICIVSAAAALQSTIGFGMGLIAAPLLLLLEPNLIPAPLILAGLVLTGLVAYRDRAHIDLEGMRFALMGRVIGIAAAAMFLTVASVRTFDLTFGCMVMLAAAASGLGLHFRPTRSTAVLAGGASGLMGTISSMAGPPMALLYQDSGIGRLRGTLAGYFVVGSVLTLAALWSVGRFGIHEAKLGVFLVPGMLAGYGLGQLFQARIRTGSIRPLVFVLSFGSGLFVFARALL